MLVFCFYNKLIFAQIDSLTDGILMGTLILKRSMKSISSASKKFSIAFLFTSWTVSRRPFSIVTGLGCALAAALGTGFASVLSFLCNFPVIARILFASLSLSSSKRLRCLSGLPLSEDPLSSLATRYNSGRSALVVVTRVINTAKRDEVIAERLLNKGCCMVSIDQWQLGGMYQSSATCVW
jgi:hypothetical protein